MAALRATAALASSAARSRTRGGWTERTTWRARAAVTAARLRARTATAATTRPMMIAGIDGSLAGDRGGRRDLAVVQPL